jgi:hypothetical protein
VVNEPPLFTCGEAAPDLIERADRWVRDIQRFASLSTPAVPCLVVTPLGMSHRPLIREVCRHQRLGFVQRAPIQDWPSASIPIYTRQLSEERLRVGLCFAALWRHALPSYLAELWLFPDAPPIDRVVAAKHIVRAVLPSLRYRVDLPGVIIPTPDHSLHLHALHSPDADRLAFELAMLRRLSDRRAWRYDWVELPETAQLN